MINKISIIYKIIINKKMNNKIYKTINKVNKIINNKNNLLFNKINKRIIFKKIILNKTIIINSKIF